MPDRRDEPAAQQQEAALRIPPTAAELGVLFGGWRGELITCRKYAPMARNYTAAKLMSLVGLRVNELRCLDLDDVKWHLGRFGKLHVSLGKGTRGSGPRERMVPLINGADVLLRWFIEDVWGLFDDDHTRPGVPLFPSERHNRDGTACRVGDDALRSGLTAATAAHLPSCEDKLTPHVLRHFCGSELYLDGADLLSIQEVLGHAWVATTMKYIHIHRTRIEDAVLAGQQRAASTRTPPNTWDPTTPTRWPPAASSPAGGMRRATRLEPPPSTRSCSTTNCRCWAPTTKRQTVARPTPNPAARRV